MLPNGQLNTIQGMDIYLIDQIMKGRYQPGQSILDAGVGGARNLNWFFHGDFQLSACDIDGVREEIIKARNPDHKFHFETCDLANMPYDNDAFDHVICNAVLHFANDDSHFRAMWDQLVRVTRHKGTIFIRTCSEIGIEKSIIPLGRGRFRLPDGSERYLMDREMISKLTEASGLDLLEPVKSVNVDQQRVMTTLVMVKKS